MSQNKMYFGLFLVCFIAIAVVIILFKVQKNPLDQISNFDQCTKAGYPVMQSYPPECTLPSGKFFVQQQVNEK